MKKTVMACDGWLTSFKIQCSANTLPEVDFADRFKQRTTEVGEEISSQVKAILEFAHFDYDETKISFSQDSEMQGSGQDRTEKFKLVSES